ncbi:Small nuclear ribonucleoprotein-associated protein N [Spatholobus suberectus]|nr:Small nuclear ribonucleoprotein-associated protein N [Spatholobus suberectus]
MSMSKSSKMLQYINYRMRVTIQDGRQLVGKFMAFDRHMNLVLGDCEEFRKLPPAKGKKPGDGGDREDRRTLGLVLLRGEEVISMTVEGPPPPEESRSKALNAAALAGPWYRPRRRQGHSARPRRPGPARPRRPRPRRRRPRSWHDAAADLASAAAQPAAGVLSRGAAGDEAAGADAGVSRSGSASHGEGSTAADASGAIRSAETWWPSAAALPHAAAAVWTETHGASPSWADGEGTSGSSSSRNASSAAASPRDAAAAWRRCSGVWSSSTWHAPSAKPSKSTATVMGEWMGNLKIWTLDFLRTIQYPACT